MAEIPANMRAAVLTEFGTSLEVVEKSMPEPQKGQVLVKMMYSPVNPSDESFIKGNYHSEKELPVIPGFEGSGLVVASGGGFLANRLLGKDVAGFAPLNGDGTWAEYMVTDAKLVVPIKKDLDKEQASMLFVNPLTAYAFAEIARKRKAKAIVNSPGASALGRMLWTMCRNYGIELVSIVRNQAQADLLNRMGNKHILNSSSPTFDRDLKSILTDLNITLCFDGVGGELPNRLLKAMPNGSEVILYGRLSEEDIDAEVRQFIFRNKSISGFWLTHWIKKKNPIQLMRVLSRVQKFLKNQHKVHIHRRLSLGEVNGGINEYKQAMSKGKMIVCPWKDKT